MIRIAAIGDLHFGRESAGSFAPHAESLDGAADVLLVAGDLTRLGEPAEAAVAAAELAASPVRVVAVLGNHDYHAGREKEVAEVLEQAGVCVLEGSSTLVEADGFRLGVAGVKGFGGGFAGACGTEFGEQEMKSFVRHTREAAERLEEAVGGIGDADARVLLLHYAPIKGTIRGERSEIFPFLGSYLLGEAADRSGADLIMHGHAHHGREHGMTPGGIPVRNVAQPVLGQAFAIYSLEPRRSDEAPTARRLTTRRSEARLPS